MAKVIKNKGRVRNDPEVALIRQRFADALSLGHSHAEAARLAHGRGPAAGPEPAPVAAEPTRAMPETSEETGETTSARPARAELLDSIPPDWQDLPYPNLKALAERLSPEAHVNSRRTAAGVIEKFIAGE